MSVNSAGNFPNFFIQQPINTTVGAPQQFQAENSQIYSDQGSIFNAPMPDIMTQVIDTQVEPVQINTTEFLENNASITDLLPECINTEGVSVQEFSATEISGDLGTNGNIYGLSYNENNENVTLFVKMTAAGPIVVANQTNDGTSSITETFNPDGTTSVSTLDNTTGEETIEKFDDNHELTQKVEIKDQGKSVTTNYANGEITSTVEQNGSKVTTKDSQGRPVSITTDKGTGGIVTEQFTYNDDGSVVTDTFTGQSEISQKQTSQSYTDANGITYTVNYTEDGNTRLESFGPKGETRGLFVESGENQAKLAKAAGFDSVADFQATMTRKGKATKGFVVNNSFALKGQVSAQEAAEFAKSRKTQELNRTQGNAAEVRRQESEQAQENQQPLISSAQINAHQGQIKAKRSNAQGVVNELHTDMNSATLKGGTLTNIVYNKVNPENAADVVIQYRGVSTGESLPEAIYDEKFRCSQSERLGTISHIGNCLIQRAQELGINTAQTTSGLENALTEAGTFGNKFNYEGFDVHMESLATSIRLTEDIPPEIRTAIQADYQQNPSDFYNITNATLISNLDQAEAILSDYTKNEGFIGKSVDTISALWDSDNRLDKLGATVDPKTGEATFPKYRAMVEDLANCSPAEYPAKFQQIYGAEYNPVTMAAYEVHQAKFEEATKVKSQLDTFNNANSTLLNYSELPTSLPQNGECPPGYKPVAKSWADGSVTYSYELANKDAAVNGRIEQFASFIGNGNKDVGMALFNNIEGWNEMDTDQKYAKLREIALDTQKGYETMLDQATDGKGFDVMKAENDVAFEAAFGSGEKAQLTRRVNNYVASQKLGESVVKGGGQLLAAAALSFVPGGPVVAATILAGLTTGVDLLDAHSSATGLKGKIGGIILENAIGYGESLATLGFSKYTGGLLKNGTINKYVREGLDFAFENALSATVTYAKEGEITGEKFVTNLAASASGKVIGSFATHIGETRTLHKAQNGSGPVRLENGQFASRKSLVMEDGSLGIMKNGSFVKAKADAAPTSHIHGHAPEVYSSSTGKSTTKSWAEVKNHLSKTSSVQSRGKALDSYAKSLIQEYGGSMDPADAETIIEMYNNNFADPNTENYNDEQMSICINTLDKIMSKYTLA